VVGGSTEQAKHTDRRYRRAEGKLNRSFAPRSANGMRRRPQSCGSGRQGKLGACVMSWPCIALGWSVAQCRARKAEALLALHLTGLYFWQRKTKRSGLMLMKERRWKMDRKCGSERRLGSEVISLALRSRLHSIMGRQSDTERHQLLLSYLLQMKASESTRKGQKTISTPINTATDQSMSRCGKLAY
jgi:hypothetical protein